MAFKVERKETPEEAIHRLGQERVDHALATLREGKQSEGVHTVRKDIKKLRAILKLVRHAIGEKAYRKQTAALRDAAGSLAATRDAHVVNQALEELTERYKGQIEPRSLRLFSQTLKRQSSEAARRFQARNSKKTVERKLRKSGVGFKKMVIPGKKAWPTIKQGLFRTYDRGRKAFQRVRKAPSDENFHEWRKRVKELWYHTRILRPIWSEQMCASAGHLNLLSEYIGDDHDLVMLNKAIAEHCAHDGDANGAEALAALIQARQNELRDAALKLGARFYFEKPSAYCRRIGCYWELWCNEPVFWNKRHEKS